MNTNLCLPIDFFYCFLVKTKQGKKVNISRVIYHVLYCYVHFKWKQKYIYKTTIPVKDSGMNLVSLMRIEWKVKTHSEHKLRVHYKNVTF